MLNEAYALWQAGEQCGIDFPDRVPGFDKGQNADGIRVFLCDDDRISRLEFVPAERMAKVRKWKRGEGITLPVFNFEPLHALNDDQFKSLKRAYGRAGEGDRISEKELAKDLPSRWERGSQSRFQKLDGALKNVSADLKSRIGDENTPHGEAWRRLLNMLPRWNADKLLNALSQAVRAKITAGSSELVWFDVLYHNAEAKKPKIIPVQFEPEGNFPYPVFSPAAQSWLKSTLLRSLDTGVPPAERRPAVWGDGGTAGEKFGEVSLPIGKVSLFNKDSGAKRTSARYGVGGPESFPVGNDVRMKLMASLEWLLAEERKDATWSKKELPSAAKKKKQPKSFLLLAYPNHLSETPPRLACLFSGASASESARAELRFETVCTPVVVALDGIVKDAPNAQINVFAIHKPDPGRVQVFYSEVIAASRLRELAEAWQRDCRERPYILIPQFPQLEKEERKRRKKEGITTNPQDYEPAIPFPYEVVECLNTIWEKCGNTSETQTDEAQDVGLSDAFNLLRNVGPKADAQYLGRLLELAVRRVTPLLLVVGQASHQTRNRVFLPQKASAKCAFQSRRWPSILGLLLTRLRYNKETYMNESAYLVGRLLAQVDRLHSYYALYVSGKESMPQLLGNSTMSIALEQPRRAFELLGQRILPYQAWAYSFSRGKHSDDQKSKDAKIIGGILWELGRISAELAKRSIPEENVASLPSREGHESRPPANHLLDAKGYAWMEVSAAAKAQMLLGYLARPPAKQAQEGQAATGQRLPDFEDER